MEMTDEQLEELESMGELLVTPEDAAVTMGLDCDLLVLELKKPESPLYTAYHSGRIKTELELRKSIIDLAKAGSSPAQTMAVGFLNSLKSKFDG